MTLNRSLPLAAKGSHKRTWNWLSRPAAASLVSATCILALLKLWHPDSSFSLCLSWVWTGSSPIAAEAKLRHFYCNTNQMTRLTFHSKVLGRRAISVCSFQQLCFNWEAIPLTSTWQAVLLNRGSSRQHGVSVFAKTVPVILLSDR